VRGRLAPGDAILIVQTGGFNTWLDVETLAAALERAIAAEPRIHFAASGGAIPGHYAGGFERFEAAARASRYADHYHLVGWRPLAEVPRLLAEADLAINLDVWCVEGRHGTRNRLMDWVLAGLPVISTPGCELAEELGKAGYLRLVPHGDAAAAARAILTIAAGPDHSRKAAGIGAAYLRRTHAAPQCLAPLLVWAGAPQSASDLQAWRGGQASPPALWRLAACADASFRQVRRQAQKHAWMERRLARLEGSRLVRWALRLRGTDDLEADPPPGEP
jgi:hypothetical protein